MVSLFVQMGPALYQGLLAGKQGREAEKLRGSTVRPTMGIQPSDKKSLGVAQQYAESRYLSGQKNIEQGSALGLAETMGRATDIATSPTELLGVLTKLQQDREKNGLELGYKAAADYDARQRNLQSGYSTMGQLERNAWDWNEKQKFQDDSAAAAALETASITNRSRALQGFGQAAGQFLSSEAAGDLFDKIGSNKRKQQELLNWLDQNNALTQSEDGTLVNPPGFDIPAGGPTDAQMLDISGLRSTDLTTQDAAATAAIRDMMRRQQQEAISRIRIPGYKAPSNQNVTGNLPMGNEVQYPGSAAYNNWAQPAPSYAVSPSVKVNMPGAMTGGGSVTGQLPGGPQVQIPSNPYESGYYGQAPAYLPVGMPSPSTYVPGSLTGQLPGSQVPQNPYQTPMGTWGQTPTSLFDLVNQISLGLNNY